MVMSRDCTEIIEAFKDAIEDEAKDQKKYAEMAAKAGKVLCGNQCPTGRIADSEIMSISADEGKHEKMLRQLLEEIEKECVESIGLGSLFG